jgi:peptidoglycan/xylan/chitin deacetylase (PgdA/CDA1 family)
LLVLAVLPACASAQTVVSLTFDDGIATQNQVVPLLTSHGMTGTFFINSGNVGANSYYMTWSNVDAVAAAGNEIGGHTVDHQRLTNLTADQQRHEICDDAATLRARYGSVIDFAYPYGAGSGSLTVRQALLDCGFAAARKYGDLYSTGCTDPSCAFAEKLPPNDAYGVRTPEFHTGPMTLPELEGWVTQAEQHGGGWVPIVVHDVCSPSCADSSVSLSDFTQFLDWLQPRAASGTIVKTMRQAHGLSPPNFVRPKGATPVYVPLVPAYEQCTAGNTSHGAPLSYPSCNPPAESSGELTVGTPDANGEAANSQGSIKVSALPGDPSTTADEADIRFATSITDVRKASDLSDYTGELEAEATVRLTDRLNGLGLTQGATVQDFDLNFAVPCAASVSVLAGSTCAITTTGDAITPGMVREGTRAIWALGPVRVLDGGPDGDASTPDNTPFLDQGLFVP